MKAVVTGTLAVIALVGLGGSASGLEANDPEWPCVQRKVESLSIGVMWPHPIPETAADLPTELQEIAAGLALRRVSEDEARRLVAAVAAERPDFGPDEYGALFRLVFERINRQRREIVTGIARYARNQARLAAESDALRAEMSQLEAAPQPDFDRIDDVEAQLDWRVRVFNDRNRSLTYVCESPVLLEQRAYAVAQMLLEAAR